MQMRSDDAEAGGHRDANRVATHDTWFASSKMKAETVGRFQKSSGLRTHQFKDPRGCLPLFMETSHPQKSEAPTSPKMIHRATLEKYTFVCKVCFWFSRYSVYTFLWFDISMMQAICQGRLLAQKCRAPSVCKASLGREGSGLLAPECLGVSITSFTLKTFAIKNSECTVFEELESRCGELEQRKQQRGTWNSTRWYNVALVLPAV